MKRIASVAAVVGLTVFSTSCSDDSTPLNVVPSDPAAYEVLEAAELQTATVATAVPESPTVKVLDVYGNPVPDVEVVFSANGGSTVEPARVRTGPDGVASTEWTLGTRVGDYGLVAEIPDVGRMGFDATATPGAPAELSIASGDGQKGTGGTRLIDPLLVRLADQYGNGVPGHEVQWAVANGGGTLSAPSSITDDIGIARVNYTLGTAVGEEHVAASLENVTPVVFTALVDNTNNLTLGALQISQATQTYEGTVPLVASRDGVLRVFGLAKDPNLFVTPVEVRFYHDGGLVHSERLVGPGDGVPVHASEAVFASSWNMRVPASLIRPGLRVVAEIDPDSVIAESNEQDNVLGRSEAGGTLDVRTPEIFEARLIPIHIPAENATGAVSDATADDYMVDAMKMLPIPGYDVDVRAPFTTSATGITESQDWSNMLLEIRQLQVAEASTRYYYGVVPNTGSPAWCGLGYLGWPAAIGLDACGAGTAAHEWGHNFDRAHTPCGGPANPDPSYPYVDATLGTYGIDVETLQVFSPNTHRDFMSYCSPEWVSDYTYRAIMDFREMEALGEREALRQSAGAEARERVVIVSGTITNGRIELSPTFRAVSVAKLPEGKGDFRLEAFADGAPVLTRSFRPERVADFPGDHQQFVFAIPERLMSGRSLERVRVTSPTGDSDEVRRNPAAIQDAQVRVQSAGPGQVRLEWDAAAIPMVVVRDSRDGAIIAFARGGSAVVHTSAPELELDLAPGVGTLERRVRIP